MNSSLSAILGITLFSALAWPVESHASLSPVTIFRGDENRIVLRTSVLRSAYLIRGGVVRFDAADMSRASVRRQLQRHFDVVIGLLLVSTPASIETALNRLEAAQGTTWLESDRADWRQRLLIARAIQLKRLLNYRDAGVFPQNDGQSSGSVPIFIDRHDTACAVGHLMRISGWQKDVALIQDSNNFVYIPEIAKGSVAAWVSTSGLTLEEAALIQPAYPNVPSELPPIPRNAAKPLEVGWSGVFDDLRFSNFRFYQHGANAPSVNADIRHSFCSMYGCSILPRFEDYTGDVEHTGWFGVLPDGFDDFERVVVQFDVETLLPAQRIISNPTGWTAYTRSGQPINGQRNSILLFGGDTEDNFFLDGVVPWGYIEPISSMPVKVFALPLIVAEDLRLGKVEHNGFKPTQRMTVVTELLLRDGQRYQTQLLHFDVVQVPEPSSIVLLMMALAAISARRWHNGARLLQQPTERSQV